MAENSHIQWTDHTFNSWSGCTKVSPGCAHCYAETLSKRNPKTLGVWGPGQPRVRTGEKYWQGPLKWNKTGVCIACGTHQASNARQPHTLSDGTICGKSDKPIFTQSFRRPRVFCASLADWLDDEVPIEWFVDLLWLIYRTQSLDWLMLSKRPQNWATRLDAAIKCEYQMTLGTPKAAQSLAWFRQWMIDWSNVNKGPAHPLVQPPGNVWIGTTVEDQARANERIPELLAIPARVRFLSCEPLLEIVTLKPEWLELELQSFGNGAHFFPRIDWVIIGGESGPGARPFDTRWARSLVAQCREAGVAPFVKQLGANPIGYNGSAPLKLKHRAGGDWSEWPDDLRVREFPAVTTSEQPAP